MKLYQLFVCFLVFFSSCETDFDVNAEWNDVTIVFGLLDPNNEIQLIKINKAYLGAGDAIQMASVSDSVNYTPSDLDVKLYRIKSLGFGQYQTLDSVALYDTIVEKDDGLFSTEERVSY